MTEPHAHRWYISPPRSEDNGPTVTDHTCRSCGETKLNVPEWKPPNQFHLSDRHKQALKEEGLE